MDETFIERLDKYKEYAGLNDNQITVKSGLTVGIINSARKRGSSLSGDNIGKILKVFKDINARWLLTGEGEMLESETIISSKSKESMPVLDIINKMLELQTELTRLKDENEILKQKLGISKAG